MANPFYEVVYLGSDVTGERRNKAVQALKLLLNAKPEDAERILESGQSFALRDRLSAEEAKKLQSALLPLGIRCNYRPCQRTQHTLEIVPLEHEEERRAVCCPECGQETQLEVGQPKPETCSHCGLSFAKHEQRRQEQGEREAIRLKLLQAHRARQQEHAEKAQRETEKRRRQQYEEEIRKELGIPVMFRTRPRIIGSASALFLTGLIGGIVGTRLLSSADAPSIVAMSAPAAVTIPSPSPSPDQYRGVAQALANAKPNIQLLDMVEAVTSSPHPPLISGPAGAMAPAVRPETRTGPQVPSGLPVGAQLIGGIEAIESLRTTILGRLAANQPQAAAALLAEIEQRLTTLSGDPEQLKALVWLGELQALAGQAEQGTQRIDQGIRLTARLGSSAERASASALLGAALIRMGQDDRGAQLLKTANVEFAAITETPAKLSAAADMAESYALAGQRGTALNLLDFVAQSAASLAGKPERNTVYHRLALAHARLQDPGGTLTAVDHLGSHSEQDDALYEAIRILLQSGRLLWASDLADRVHTPLAAVSALALLAEAQTGPVESAAEAQQTFDRAESAAALVSEPQDKVQALARLGTAYLAANRDDRATSIFDAAQTLARSLPGEQKDVALATIAAAQAEGLAIDQALATVNEIAGPATRARIQAGIEGARRVAAALQAQPA